MLVARRQLKWQGREFAPGQPLDPQPSGLQRQRLIDGLFVLEGADESPVAAPGPVHVVALPPLAGGMNYDPDRED